MRRQAVLGMTGRSVRPRPRVRPSGVRPRTRTKSNASSIFIGADRGDKMSLWYVHGFGLMIQRG